MSWLERAQEQYARYRNGDMWPTDWEQIATDLLEELLESNADVLDRLKNF